jgi:hypothetical protein
VSIAGRAEKCGCAGICSIAPARLIATPGAPPSCTYLMSKISAGRKAGHCHRSSSIVRPHFDKTEDQLVNNDIEDDNPLRFTHPDRENVR